MDWSARVRQAFDRSGRTPDDDVIEELAQHARATYEAVRTDGGARDDAERAVAQLLAQWRREAAALHHRRRRLPHAPPPPASSSLLDGVAQDLRYAARLLWRQPRYTFLIVLTMALGIGATTALFSVTYGVLMRPFPWPNADRIVVLTETRGGHTPRFGAFSNTAYAAWQQDAATIDALAAWSQSVVTLTDAGEPERVQVTSASATLFPALGVTPLIGGLFTATDEQSPVIVLAERLWRRRFSADPAVIDRIVRLDGRPHRIIGVVSDAVAFPNQQAEAFVPFHVAPVSGNLLSMFNAVAALKPGFTAEQAAAEGTTRGRFAAPTGLTTTAIFGGDGPVGVSAMPFSEAFTADVRRPLLVLLVAVGLLLATATANIAGLQLARSTTRRREMAIRSAIGCNTGRLTRQLLIENLLLGAIGGAAGVLLAWWLHRLLPSLLPADFPRVTDIRLDAPVVVCAIGISIATSLCFGWLPALRARAQDVTRALADDGAAPVGAGARSRTARARLLIMTAQIAITAVLLIGGALLARSFLLLLTVDRGYDPSGVLTARLALPGSLYSPERRFVLVTELLEKLAAVPSVTAAAFTSELPLTAGGSTASFKLQSPTDGSVVTVQASPRVVSPRALTALRLRLIAGRGFADTDTEAAEPVAVVNRAFAQKYLGGLVLDATIPMGVGYSNADRNARVIGIVENVRYVTTNDTALPEIYYSYRQLSRRLTVPGVTLIVRTSGEPAAMAAALRTAIGQADRTLVAASVATMDERILGSLGRPRLYAVILGGFASLSLLVSAVGLFGVLSYTVALRSRELAVRTALGARSRDIVLLIVRQGLTITIAGLGAGLLASFTLTPLMSGLLYGVAAHDRLTYAIVSLVLIGIAAAACVGPAHRAIRINPLHELR